MAIIQNMVDKFYSSIGKSDKVYPVKVEKHRVKDPDGENPEIVLEGFDRGRTTVDSDSGNKIFDLKNERNIKGIVQYDDFLQDINGEKYASVLIVDRDHLVPLGRSYDVDEDFEGSGMNELRYNIKTPRMKDLCLRSYEQEAKIVETSEEKWWNKSEFKAAILFVGAGLFFVLASFAQGELYMKELAENMANLESAIRESGTSISGGGN